MKRARLPARLRAVRAWTARHATLFGWSISIAFVAVFVAVLLDNRGEIRALRNGLGHVHVVPLLVACAAEAVSIAALAAVQKVLLARGGCRPSFRRLVGVTLVVMACGALPVGAGVGAVYSARQYRRMGASLGTAVQVVVLVVVLTGVALGVFGAVGAVLLSPSFWGVVVAIAAVAAAPLAVLAYRQVAVRMRWARGGLVLGLALAFAYLAFDCVGLAASFWATATPVPWRGLPAAYTAGQLASQVPFAPGGTGVVETALDQVVTLNGGSTNRFLPGIFLYRLVGFWGLVLAGLVALVALRLADARLSARRGPAARSRRRSSQRARRSRSPRAA